MAESIQAERANAARTWALAMWLFGSAFIVYLVAFAPVFLNGTASAYSGLEETRFSHYYYGSDLGLLPYLAALFFLWRNRSNFALTPPQSEPSITGVVIAMLGGLVFIAAARLQDPRLGMFSLPILLLGLSWSIGGKKTARAIGFPAFWLLFTLPIPGLVTATWHAMGFIARTSYTIISFLGVDATLVGSHVSAKDGSWEFMLSEGSSSDFLSPLLLIFVAIITAKLMLARVWKQFALVANGLLFALLLWTSHTSIGLMIADRFGADRAGQFFHSPYITFACICIWLAGLMTLAIWLRPLKQFSVRQHQTTL